MCIICYKPAGELFPEDYIYENCYDNNSDGNGLMYIRNGKVHYEKGLMKLADLKNKIAELSLSIDDHVAFHFRITTSGGTWPGATHPFPVTSIEQKLKTLSGSVNAALMHNGVLGRGIGDMSDTMIFVRDIVSNPIIKSNLSGKYSEYAKNLLEELSDGSKLLIFTGDGNVIRTGDWQSSGGLYFSNSTWSYRTYYSGGRWKENKFNYTDSYDDNYYWYRRGGLHGMSDDTPEDEEPMLDCPWCLEDSQVVSPTPGIYMCKLCKMIFDEDGEILYCADWDNSDMFEEYMDEGEEV